MDTSELLRSASALSKTHGFKDSEFVKGEEYTNCLGWALGVEGALWPGTSQFDWCHGAGENFEGSLPSPVLDPKWFDKVTSGFEECLTFAGAVPLSGRVLDEVGILPGRVVAGYLGVVVDAASNADLDFHFARLEGDGSWSHLLKDEIRRETSSDMGSIDGYQLTGVYLINPQTFRLSDAWGGRVPNEDLRFPKVSKSGKVKLRAHPSKSESHGRS